MDRVATHFEARPHRRWRARWIWNEVPDRSLFIPRRSGPERWVAFRRRFTVEQVPDAVPTRIFADGRFVAWVNGREVARGPVRAPRGAARYAATDLAPFLEEGDNVVAVLVHHPGEALPWWVPEQPTGELGRGALAMELDLGDVTIGTDCRWRCSAEVGRTSAQAAEIRGLPVEVMDAAALAGDWTAPGFDDAAWAPAVELDPCTPGEADEVRPPSMPYGRLLPPPWRGVEPRRRELTFAPATRLRPAAPLTASSLARALAGEAAGEAADLFVAVVADVTCGTLEIDGFAGGPFRFAVVGGELLDGGDLGADRIAEGTGVEGRFRIETIHPRGFRRLAVAVAPAGAVRIERAVLVERFSVPRRTATFTCSDTDLEAIWEAGRRTVDLCSLDTYVDCPTREQRAWSVDAVVPTMVDLATSDRWDLPRWSLELRSVPRGDGMLPMVVVADLDGPVYIPLVVCHQVRALRELWRYTGDRELVGDLLGTYRRAVAWFADLQRDDGLVWDVPGWMFVDWTAVETRGASAILNGLWGRALLDLTELARAIGDEATERWAQERHRRLRAGFERFWDPVRGRYLDHVAEEGGVQASEHAQAAAVVGGMVPDGRLPAVAAVMLDRDRLVPACWQTPPGTPPPEGTNVVPVGSIWAPHPEPWWDVDRELVAAQPFFRYVVHDAVVAAGRAEVVPALCRDWKPLLRRGGGTLGETWDTGTTCHAWSATPTRDLVTVTLGVRPAVPGFGVVLLAPVLGDLDRVAATLPHPEGELAVEVTRDRVEVRSPVPVRFDPAGLWEGPAVDLPAGRQLLTP